MNQERWFDVEGALSREENAELPASLDLILFPEIDAAAYELEDEVRVHHQIFAIHNIIAEVEDEAHEAGLLDVDPPQQLLDVAAVLQAFQEREFHVYGPHLLVPQETENFYDFSSDENSEDDQDSEDAQDSEDDQDSEPGEINMHQLVDSPKPADHNMDQNSDSAGDINMMDENPDSPAAGDINKVNDNLVPARDIDIDQYSEPEDHMMDLDSDTNMDDNLAEFQSIVLQEPQMHDLMVAETTNEEFAKKTVEQVETSTLCLDVSHEVPDDGVVESPTQSIMIEELNRFSDPLSDHFSLIVVPSPLLSSQLQPGTLTICESSLEPNPITTTIRSAKTLD